MFSSWLLAGVLFGEAVSHGADPSVGFELDRHPEALTALSLPESSRADVPDRVPVPGPWLLVRTVDGVRVWEAPLPVRLRALFFNNPPEDMALYRDQGDKAKPVRHASGLYQEHKADTWELSAHGLQVRRPASEGPPTATDYNLRYDRALTREKALNQKFSGLDGAAFAFRSVQVEDTTRHGLLLPAPAQATFQVQVPEGAVFDFDASLIPPEAVSQGVSDGARLIVEIGAAGGAMEPIADVSLKTKSQVNRRISLQRWFGQTISLRLRVDPGETPDLDYVFIAEPVIFVPVADPPRVVVIFIDTLRPDHMSLYGAEHQTTPNLDKWAKDAAIFENARSVAPWTLPSSRTILTGAQPERWGNVKTVQDRYAEAGWATGFMVGNTYLSSNFGMADGWGVHRCINWPIAGVQVDRALDFLDRYKDRPAMLVLHFMDMHLPYKEPPWWRFKFAGTTPEAIGDEWFLRGSVMRMGSRLPASAKQYVQDRYDNNLAYVDNEIARLLRQLDPSADGQDAVVLLADHGEEFWDHGGFEHGHTLYDELLRVPLVVRAPGINAGRYDAPVSLLDVAPTLLTLTGLSTDGTTGVPLQALTNGGEQARFEARPQAFGRPLYGLRAWGVLADGEKYTTSAGSESLYDLRVDPKEKDDVMDMVDAPAWRARLSEGVGSPAVLGWRIIPSSSRLTGALHAELIVPGGVAAAWVADDPVDQSDASVTVDGERVSIVFGAVKHGAREVYVVPKADPTLVLPTLSLSGKIGKTTLTAKPTWDLGADPPAPGDSKPLYKARAAGQGLDLTWAVAPEPSADSTALVGYDPESADSLKALGYIDDE